MDKSEAYHRQMTQEKVWLLIIKLGIPTTITMLITQLYNMVDTYFVGTLGTSQQGATGILFTLQSIIQAFAFLFGHGSGTHIAKKLAQKDVKGASVYAATAFYVGFAIGGLLLLFGLMFLGPFMTFLGSSETILPYAKEYGMWVLISAPFLITSLILNNVLRYEGKAMFAMIGLVTGAVLNVLGDYIFIDVMGLGVFGAGMSTGISQIVSFLLLLFFFIAKAQSKINPKDISRQFHIYKNILVAGLPSLIRQGLLSISGGVLNNLTKPLGDAAVAAISIVNRCSNFVMCVGLGVAQGFQPVAAYNYTVNEYGRVRKGCLFTWFFITIVVVCLSLFAFLMPGQIMSMFIADPEVIELGIVGMRHLAWSLIVMPLCVVGSLTFQAVRKSWTATLLACLRNGIAFIPTIFILVSGMGLGFTGIALSQPIADLITAAITLPFLLYFLVGLHKKEKAQEEAKEC